MRVLKFGGSSISVEGLERMQKIVSSYLDIDEKVIIIFSAMQKTTDLLYKTAIEGKDKLSEIKENHMKILKELSLPLDLLDPEFDFLKTTVDELNSNPLASHQACKKIKIIGSGEVLSTKFIAEYFSNKFDKVKRVSALRFIQNVNKGSDIDPHTLTIPGEFKADPKIIQNLMGDNNIMITQGFIARTVDDRMCIMTRSGSDTSACLIGSVIGCPVEIWTDVSGVYTSDPRIVPTAQVIPNLSYDICQEISVMGSHVIHPLAIKPCKEANVEIFIKNTRKPDDLGTRISREDCHKDIYAISLQKNISVIQVSSLDMWNHSGFAGRFFAFFSKYEIDINIITTSSDTITITTESNKENSPEKLDKLYVDLVRNFTDVKYYPNQTIVSLIGNNLLVKEKEINKKIIKIVDAYESKLSVFQMGSNRKYLSYGFDHEIAIIFSKELHEALF